MDILLSPVLPFSGLQHCARILNRSSRRQLRSVGVGVLLCIAASLLTARAGEAQDAPAPLQRGGNPVLIEPYAPNIVRVTLRLKDVESSPKPGYGVIAAAQSAGWSASREADGTDVLRSDRMSVRLAGSADPPRPMPLDALNLKLRDKFFPWHPGDPRYSPHRDVIKISTADGKPLLTMNQWLMSPNKDDATAIAANVPKAEGYRVEARFDAVADEHFYGLGQHQQGFLDLRGHRIDCWHQYNARGGEEVCVPFLVSSRGYGVLWDNPSKTHVDLALNGQTEWSSDIGDRVSFFVIAGNTTDEIYAGYRLLTGVTHLLPKAGYGYIQSKAIYATEQQVLDVAKGYRQRNLPADVMVVDFLNMTEQGEMDLDPARWPQPARMNDTLHSLGFGSMLSVWPHYMKGTQFYDMLKAKGWLIHRPDGTLDQGGYSDAIGPNIDTTNPEAAQWFWEKIRDRYIKPFHFDYLWLDETEPDVDPANDVFFIGSGPRFYNVYPLFHTAAIYDGFRRDYGDTRRVMSLARAAYTGAQRNGTVFWSSDIVSTWDMLRRSIPAGLNFTASGMPYWNTDVAGFFSPSLPERYQPEHKPLLDPADVLDNVGRYVDYPELYTRWFQWSVFQPVMRTHGERQHNEVWSYGKEAEPILSKYLRLRYQLLPYIYSLGYSSYRTGAPFMRALFMDFGSDPHVANITDEYMFGPAFLVAPVVDQGATSREVYLPAGTDWYSYWTHERFHGGQTITVAAPIDTLPLFVRAGSIVTLGSPILSTGDAQAISRVEVYRGQDTDFTLFADDGTTYDYEHGAGSVTQLHWNERSGRLTHTGVPAWKGEDSAVVQVIGERGAAKP